MSIRISTYTDKLTPALLDLLFTADPSEAMIKGYWETSEVLVAKNDDKIIGIAALIAESPTKAEIKNIAVLPEYQCRGIARDLIEEIKIASRAKNLKQLVIGTGNSSFHQMKLYQRCGFRIDSIEHDFFLKYPEPLKENGIRCLDLIWFSLTL